MLKSKRTHPVQSSRSGITVTEVMVAIGVFTLLMAIVIPAVQSARESARRTECLNNLRQLGAAMMQFESQNKELPHDGATHWELLSFLDHAELNDTIQRSLNSVGEKEEVIYPTASIPVFGCPSDQFVRPGSAPNFMDEVSYRINFGTQTDSRYADGFAGKGRVRISQIRDGASNTAFMAERLVLLRSAMGSSSAQAIAAAEPLRFGWHLKTEYPVPHGTFDETVAVQVATDCQIEANRLEFGPNYNGRATHVWNDNWWVPFNNPAGYVHSIPPNGYSCISFGTGMPSNKVYAATSNHTGTVNVCMIDGSVKSVSESIDADVWLAIGTRAAGEAVSNF